MPALVAIPARYASTRFPGKPLASLLGKPLIQHVYENVSAARLATEVLVATDSPDIRDAVLSFGGRAVLTSPDHPSGTDRIAEVAAGTACDIIVNVQGDEPLLRPSHVDAAVVLLEDGRADMGTLAVPLTDPAEARDPNVVKVAFGRDGFALYFSRAPIPYHRDLWASLDEAGGGATLHKHIGIYSYRRDALLGLTKLPPTALETTERLEQLRALEHGMRIRVGITEHDTLGVDTPADLEKVRQCLSTSS
jgi:3-deoxy-manno-octulosonate cytidylyltransferase (CMP-KDO synthetase)